MTKRQEQALATQQKIVQTATSLFVEKGFNNVTIDEIASSIGLSKGALYHHFESKDAIVLWIYRKEMDKLFSERLESYIESSDTYTLLSEFIKICIESSNSLSIDLQRQYYRILATLPNTCEGSLMTRNVYHVLKDIILNGQKKGEINTEQSPEFYTNFVTAAINGIISFWSINDDSIELNSFASKSMQYIYKAIK